jgi:predicted transcriptional regulator
MNKSLPVSIRLEPEVNEQVTSLASILDRPKSWVIEQAVKDYIVVQQWQLSAIDEGIQAADAGRLVSHDDVSAWVQSWGKTDELPQPE